VCVFGGVVLFEVHREPSLFRSEPWEKTDLVVVAVQGARRSEIRNAEVGDGHVTLNRPPIFLGEATTTCRLLIIYATETDDKYCTTPWHESTSLISASLKSCQSCRSASLHSLCRRPCIRIGWDSEHNHGGRMGSKAIVR
jgi:hypothetical protein